MSSPPGFFHSPRRAKQLISFAGLKFGTITPTDLDGLIEYHNQQFAFLEIKGNGVLFQRWYDECLGQRLALERIVDRLEHDGARGVIFFSHHAVIDPNNQIDAARTLVIAKYEHQKWVSLSGMDTLRQVLDRWFDFTK